MVLTPTMKFFLVATHFIPYFLIPLMLWSVNHRKENLSKKMNSILLYQLGLFSILVGLVAELMWHQFVQDWIYTNDTHIFNMFMYLFMNLGFAFMSLGIKRRKIWDEVLVICALCTPLIYYVGVKEIIWGIQLWGLIAITINAKQVLQDKLVYLFPLFSFVVNMIFIMLLFQTDNPLYHILHDITGTLLGFAILGYAFWRNSTHEQE